MAATTAPDLAQIELVRSAFLDCLISAIEPDFEFGRVAGFASPAITAQSFYSPEQQEVGLRLYVQALALDAERQQLPVVGRFCLAFAFRVGNLPELLHLNPEQPEAGEVPNLPLTATLLGVAYSTARGMILSKVADTALNGFALPLRSVQQLLADSAAAAAQAAATPAPEPAKAKRAKRTT